MKNITSEWVAKAEGDFAMMQRESRARKSPNFDGICFHAQQCAEKYLKGLLAQHDISFGKTHDLAPLLDQLLPLYPKWEDFRRDLAYLSAFAVAFRYQASRPTRNRPETRQVAAADSVR
jgi:HEPN domain-containing protein